MKNRLPKNIIVPAWFGMVLYFVVFLGANSDFFADSSAIIWIGVLLSVLVLCGLVLGIVNNITNLEVGFAGLKLTSLVFELIIPIGFFSYSYFYKEPQITYSSLLEKENIKLNINSKACERIKYGTFTNSIDTTIRYSEKNLDFEIIKTTNQQIKNRIKWLDSCSYSR